MQTLLVPKSQTRERSSGAGVLWTIRCDACAMFIANVPRTHAGLVPSGALCIGCSHPAWSGARN